MRGKILCKQCGSAFSSIRDVKIIKTWHMVSPIPDKQGRLSINVMAVWECPICGARNRGKISTIRTDEAKRSRNYTQMLIDIIMSRKKISINELAEKFSTKPENIKKALEYLAKKKIIDIEIVEDYVIAR